MTPQNVQSVTEVMPVVEEEVKIEMEKIPEEEEEVSVGQTAPATISSPAETIHTMNEEDDIETELNLLEKRANRFNVKFDREAQRSRLLEKRTAQQQSKPTESIIVMKDKNQFASRRLKLGGMTNTMVPVDEETLAARRKRFGGVATTTTTATTNRRMGGMTNTMVPVDEETLAARRKRFGKQA